MFREIVKAYVNIVEYEHALEFMLQLKEHMSIYSNYLSFIKDQKLIIRGNKEDQKFIEYLIDSMSPRKNYTDIIKYIFVCLFELKTFNKSICFVYKYTLNEDTRGYILEYLHRNSNNFKTTHAVFQLRPLADSILFKIEYKNMSITYSIKQYIVNCVKENSQCTPWYKIKT